MEIFPLRMENYINLTDITVIEIITCTQITAVAITTR